MTIALAIPTFDNTAITWDTINFTFDGACLINGGASVIPHNAQCNYEVSKNVDVPLFVQYKGGT
jgi:hypothetical protein